MTNEIIVKRELKERTKILSYDKSLCTGCTICESICPSSAIKLGPIGAIKVGKLEDTNILLNEKLCTLCGTCAIFCFNNALKYFVNGVRIYSLKYSEGYARLTPKITIDKSLCILYIKKEFCKECEEACPTRAIEILSIKEAQYELKLNEDICYYCGKCKERCPANAIRVQKPFEGKISIDYGKCENCDLCTIVCPTRAIKVATPEEPYNKAERYAVDESYCIFCGSCIKVCPANAIKMERIWINVGGAPSTAWRTKWEGVHEPAHETWEVSIDFEKCTGCGNCVVACPRNAIYDPASKTGFASRSEEVVIRVAKGRVGMVNSELCNGCGNCVEVCSVKAIRIIPKTGKI